MKKRFLAVFLALCLALSLLPCAAFAKEDTAGKETRTEEVQDETIETGEKTPAEETEMPEEPAPDREGDGAAALMGTVDGETIGDLIFYRDAEYLADGATIQLTPAALSTMGSVWYKAPFDTTNGLDVSFDYWADGGDGMVLVFSDKTGLTSDADGGNFGFQGQYGIELDSFCNFWYNDPDGGHAAIVKDDIDNHLKSVSDSRVADGAWHHLSANYRNGSLSVFLDGGLVLSSDSVSLNDEVYVGITGANGGAGVGGQHSIKQFEVAGGAAPDPGRVVGDFIFYKDANYLADGAAIQLTPAALSTMGSVWYKAPFDTTNGLDVSFDYWADGGDGMVLVFSDKTGLTSDADGGNFGFQGQYGIELDSFCNSWYNDPDDNGHIAVIQGNVDQHLAYLTDSRVVDGAWHHLTVQYQNNSISVFLDGALALSCSGVTLQNSSYIGITATNGGFFGQHIVKNLKVTKGTAGGQTSYHADSALLRGFNYNKAAKEWTYYFDKPISGGPDGVGGTHQHQTFTCAQDYTILLGMKVKPTFTENVVGDVDKVYSMTPDGSRVILSGIVGDLDDVMPNDTKINFDDRDYDLDSNIGSAANIPVYTFQDGALVISDTPAMYPCTNINAVEKDRTTYAYTIKGIDNDGNNAIDLFVMNYFLVDQVGTVSADGFTTVNGGSFRYADVTCYSGMAEGDFVIHTPGICTATFTDNFKKVDTLLSGGVTEKYSDYKFDLDGMRYKAVYNITTGTSAVDMGGVRSALTTDKLNVGDYVREMVVVNRYVFSAKVDPSGGTAIPVTDVSLSVNNMSMRIGETRTLTATVSPAGATNKAVIWNSDTPTVATVSNGVVTAVAPGTAKITVTTADGGKTDSCTVTVIPSSGGGGGGVPLQLVGSYSKSAKTATISVMTTEAITLSNYQLTLGWDASLFTLSDMTNGQPALFGTFQKNIEQGEVGATSSGDNVTVAAGETLVTYTLTTASVLALGDYGFTLFIKDASDKEGTALPWKGLRAAGTLTVSALSADNFDCRAPGAYTLNCQTPAAGDFTVASKHACIVLYHNGTAYQKLAAAPAGENVYAFTLPADYNDAVKLVIAVKGDLNGDGEINSTDSLQVLRCAVGNRDFDAVDVLICDINGDEELTSTDSLQILRVAVSLRTLVW